MSLELKNELAVFQAHLDTANAIFDSRGDLYKRIGTNQISPKGIEPRIKEEDNPLKVGLAREAVYKSQLRIVGYILELREKVGEAKLLVDAEDYLKIRDRKKDELDKLRGLSRHLSPEIVKKQEDAYRLFENRQNTDEGLKRGLQLLEERRKQEEEALLAKAQQARVPNITVKRSSGEVLVDVLEMPSKRCRITSEQVAALGLFASEPNQTISALTFTKKIREFGLLGASLGYNTIQRLRSALEIDPRNPSIIISTGSKAKMQYHLQGSISFIDDQEIQSPALGVKKDQINKSVPESRLKALTALINNPRISFTQLIELLGPDKNHRKLHSGNAKYALIRAVDTLRVNISTRKATPEEAKLWQDFNIETQETMYSKVGEKIKAKINKWFEENKPPSAAPKVGSVEIEPEKLTAIKLIIEHPEITIDGLIDALPLTKSGRRLTGHQAQVSIYNIIRRLCGRGRTGAGTPEEQQIWSLIKEFAGENYHDQKARVVACEKINQWFVCKNGKQSNN
ncbi:MAG: hypothetical protein PHQ59_05705 [Candidatus Daviesbacteria bacterium]|nr:hypothetical protein [Candidatus Daviesbacteria bacterium]